VIAFDHVGHGLSDKAVDDYTPAVFAEQLRELMDALRIDAAHLSGESLGGWVSGLFAAKYPQRVRRLMLNTAGGIPVVSAKGQQDLQNFMALNKRNVDAVPNRESVTARMQWLMHPSNHHLLAEELIDLRLRIYLAPETRRVAPKINAVIQRHDEFLIPLEALHCETLFLWTRDNPIHDLEAAHAAAARVPGSTFYLMQSDAAHWPQYEAPDEFNAVTASFFSTGRLQASPALLQADLNLRRPPVRSADAPGLPGIVRSPAPRRTRRCRSRPRGRRSPRSPGRPGCGPCGVSPGRSGPRSREP